MNPSHNLLDELNPDCPISNRVLLKLYTRDLSDFPEFDMDDPEYCEKVYLAYQEHKHSWKELEPEESLEDSVLCANLNAITWVICSGHCCGKETFTYEDLYQAMSEFETLQYRLRDIEENGFISDEINP